MENISFNILAILAAGLASVLLGGAYVGVFGKQGAKVNGYTEGQAKRAQKESGAKGYIGITLANLAMAFGLAYFVSALGTDNMSDLLWLTFWAFVGFVGPLSLAPVLWENKSIKLWVFNNVINVVCVFVMVLILANWR